MKALILNSGIGSRLKSRQTCKCLSELADGVTILDMQISALLRCGVNEICITTGPYADLLEKYVCGNFPLAEFEFVHNPLYESTNYIYSMHLASDILQGCELLLLHGDLIFEQNVLQDVLVSEHSVMAVDSTRPLPERDFKAQIREGRVVTVSTKVFENALYAQPLYKLSKHDWNIWRERIDSFCKQGATNVYAEEAFNEASGQMNVLPFELTGRVCFEVDTDDDLEYARDIYAKMPDRLQTVYSGLGSRRMIKDILKQTCAKKPLVVCGSAREKVQEYFGTDAVYFSGFKPNPEMVDIDIGRKLFEKEKCDFIVSVGGGSAIDTAKCIKGDNPQLRHLAIPTSAGTGSESTSFAVVYENGVKQSIENAHIMPDYVILDSYFLETLTDYHKKSTLLDALCQATESLWAKGRTPESETYARAARKLIWENATDYLTGKGSALCAQRVLGAANLAGKAINISKTTAAHAMSYKLSAIFGIAHGHAVALCLVPVWRHLLETGNAPGALSEDELEDFVALFDFMNLSVDFGRYKGDMSSLLQTLAASVNAQRLGNHPVALTEDELADMYKRIC